MAPGKGFRQRDHKGRGPRHGKRRRGPSQGEDLPPGLGAAWWSEHPVRPEVPIRPEKLAVWVLTQNPRFLKNSHNQLYFS